MCDKDPDDSWVCSCCIGEPWLRKYIAEDGEQHTCHYCGETDTSFSLDTIASLTETAILQHYERTEDVPSDLDYTWIKHSDSGWERHGEVITDVIENLLITSPAVAQDIQAMLEERHSGFASDLSGEECEFEAESHYTERRDEDTRAYEQMWDQFVHSLKTESRYINTTVLITLGQIFKGLAGMQGSNAPPLLLEAGPDTTVKGLYRARYSPDQQTLEKILINPDRELGPPPFRMSGTNRMSAKGISVFYGASSPDTAISEIRPPVGSNVISARFNLIRPLMLLNLPALAYLRPQGSMFDPAFIKMCQQIAFLSRLTGRIVTPVMPGDEDFDYLPTQVIAEYLADPTGLNLDGILYPSVQQSGEYSPEHYNVVLFHKASRVNYMTLPAAEDCMIRYGNFIGENEWEMDITVTELTDATPPPVAEQTSDVHSRPADGRIPSLTIELSSVTVHDIRRINFKYDSETVTRRQFSYGSARENRGDELSGVSPGDWDDSPL